MCVVCVCVCEREREREGEREKNLRLRFTWWSMSCLRSSIGGWEETSSSSGMLISSTNTCKFFQIHYYATIKPVFLSRWNKVTKIFRYNSIVYIAIGCWFQKIWVRCVNHRNSPILSCSRWQVEESTTVNVQIALRNPLHLNVEYFNFLVKNK